MTEKCFDIGTIQAFLDGELAVDKLETVSRHISVCDDCAILLADAEEETALTFSALEEEFSAFVPTNRLWTKINDSIERNKKTFWQTVFARFSNPTVAVFASLVIVVGLFVAMLSVKTNDNQNFIAKNNSGEQITTSPISKVDLPQNAQFEPKVSDTESVIILPSNDDKNKPRIVKATFSEKENSQRQIGIQKSNSVINKNPKSPVDVEPTTSGENLSGEDSYVITIATLEKTVDSHKDEVLKPAARFAFERDLAVTDDAIKKMRAEVKKNPKNEAAKDVLRASYENKIDLLNSVAEKTELMASLK
jgi:predicted RND superfamily exporter protein